MEEFKVAALLFSIFAPFSWFISMLMSGMQKMTTKRHLVFLMASASFVYIMTYAKFQEHLVFYTTLFPIQALVVPLLFPLFFLYVQTMTSEKRIFNWRYYVHYVIPFILFLSYFFVSKIWMNAEEEKRYMVSLLSNTPGNEAKFVFGYYLFGFGRLYYLLSSVFYLIIISRCYTKYKTLILNIFPSDHTKELNWIKGIGLLLIGVTIFNLIIHYMRNNDLASHDMLIAFSYLTFGSFFWILGLYGYRQKEVYNPIQIAKTEVFIEDIRISKKDIEEYLNTSKVYLNTNINIYDLCDTFKTNRTYLSAEINSQFQMNFRTLINSYRIKEAKNILIEAKKNKIHSSFEQIAIDTGFNSYSSFLRVFKMTEGVSPSEFYKTI